MSAYTNPNPIKFKLTGRDGWQSNHAMMVTASEVNDAYAHIGEYGVASAQTMGGTTDDLSLKNGRSPLEHMKEVGRHHAQARGLQTALIRGEVGFGYERQPLDVLKASVERVATSAGGTIELQNFNAMNDIDMMRGVVVAAKQLNEEKGLDVKVRGGICIQENLDTQSRRDEIIAEYVDHARDLIATGHEDFYLKCANGVLPDPSFVADIITALKAEFPEQEIDIHLHNTYGYAPSVLEAAVAAGADGFDLLPDALAEGTAQMSMSMAMHILENSADPKVRVRKSGFNFEAMRADKDAAYRTRAAYSDTEFKYDLVNRKKAEAAGSAGGAVSALKKVDGLIPNIASVIGVSVDDWDGIRNAIYGRKERNRKALGCPTNVTPLEFMQDMQAAMDVFLSRGGNEALQVLQPATIDYLTGQLGKVSKTVDRALQNKAFLELKDSNGQTRFKEDDLPDLSVDPNAAIEQLGLKLPSIEQLPPGLPVACQQLIDAGVEDPTDDQILNVVLSNNGLKFETGQIPPLEEKALPKGFNKGEMFDEIATPLIETAYLSVEIKKFADGFYKGFPNSDGYVVQLEDRIKQNNDAVKSFVADNDLNAAQARYIRGFSYSLASKLGGDTSCLPLIISEVKHEQYASPFKNKVTSLRGALSKDTG